MSYCQGNNYVLTTEKIYPSLAQMDLSQDIDEKTPHMGRVMMADRIDHCCIRTPIKYSVILNEAGTVDDKMVPVVGVLLRTWLGLPVPCRCCMMSPASAPSGVSCVDIGRSVDALRGDMHKILEFCDSNDPAVLAAKLTAQFGGVDATMVAPPQQPMGQPVQSAVAHGYTPPPGQNQA